MIHVSNTTNTTETTNAADEEMVRIGVRIPESLWRTVKAAAMLDGETAEARVARILDEYETAQAKRSKR